MQFDQVLIPLHNNFAKCQFSFGYNKNSQEWNAKLILNCIVTFPLFQLPLPNLQTPPTTDQKPEGGNGE